MTERPTRRARPSSGGRLTPAPAGPRSRLCPDHARKDRALPRRPGRRAWREARSGLTGLSRWGILCMGRMAAPAAPGPGGPGGGGEAWAIRLSLATWQSGRSVLQPSSQRRKQLGVLPERIEHIGNVFGRAVSIPTAAWTPTFEVPALPTNGWPLLGPNAAGLPRRLARARPGIACRHDDRHAPAGADRTGRDRPRVRGHGAGGQALGARD